jgi:hypothetical protein
LDELAHANREYGGVTMKHWKYRNVYYLGLLIVICVASSVRTLAGGIAVSDGSKLPSDDGCMLAYMYNQEGDHRLVVIDGKNHRQYEASLDNSRMAPFWEGGKVYVVAHSGMMQGFTISSDKLVAAKEETISAGVVRHMEYVRSQHRLYLIRTGFDDQRKIFYELSAIDFPARKTLWTKRIDDPGLLTILDGYVCVTGLKLVEVFNSETGEKIGTIAAAKSAPSEDAKSQK